MSIKAKNTSTIHSFRRSADIIKNLKNVKSQKSVLFFGITDHLKGFAFVNYYISFFYDIVVIYFNFILLNIYSNNLLLIYCNILLLITFLKYITSSYRFLNIDFFLFVFFFYLFSKIFQATFGKVVEKTNRYLMIAVFFFFNLIFINRFLKN